MTLSTVAEVTGLLDVRHDMPTPQLCLHIRKNFHGNVNSLRILEPFVREVLRRFKHLPRKKQVDGTYATIDGEKSFAKWCVVVLKKNPRTVRYMLAGGNKQRQAITGKTVSATQVRITKYLEKQLRNFGNDKRQEISVHLVAFLERETP